MEAMLNRARATPYHQILGHDFDLLHPHVQRAHVDPLVAIGSMKVTHGTTRLVPFFVRAMELPKAGPDQSVELTVDGDTDGQTWSRKIGCVLLRSHQSASGSLLYERGRSGAVIFALQIVDGALLYEQKAARFWWIPVPRFLSPMTSALVSPTEDGWHVEVTITWRGNLICQYNGTMRAQ